MRAATGPLLTALYLTLALVPLAVVLAPPRPAGGAFWLELSLALGFIGLGQLALQFGLIARFERISRPLGIDLVMQWHRQVGIVAMLVVLAHPLVLVLWRADYIGSLDPIGSGAATATGVWAVLAMLLLVVLSLRRRPLGLSYEAWRVSHALLGIAALVLAQAHVTLIGRFAGGGWKAAALWAWCAAFVGLIAYLRLVKPFLLRRRAWEVREVRAEAGATWSLALAPTGHAGLAFAPGQFAWIKVGTSPWSVDEHPFSFSSSAERTAGIEFAIKELGDFTAGIGQVRPGTAVYVDGPHGSFSCDFGPADGFVFIAGGIGIGPIISMVRTLADRGDPRPVTLVYACSRWDRVAFREELAERARHMDLRVVYVLEEPHAGWDGPVGYITRELMAPLVAGGPRGTRVLMCGPDAMMDAVGRILRDLGMPDARVEMERFNLV
jgi:predicted ferric reductase